MKRKDLHRMSDKEVSEKLVELRKELMKENAQKRLKASGQNTKRIRSIKRTIAQLNTKMKEVVEKR